MFGKCWCLANAAADDGRPDGLHDTSCRPACRTPSSPDRIRVMLQMQVRRRCGGTFRGVTPAPPGAAPPSRPRRRCAASVRVPRRRAPRASASRPPGLQRSASRAPAATGLGPCLRQRDLPQQSLVHPAVPETLPSVARDRGAPPASRPPAPPPRAAAGHSVTTGPDHSPPAQPRALTARLHERLARSCAGKAMPGASGDEPQAARAVEAPDAGSPPGEGAQAAIGS